MGPMIVGLALAVAACSSSSDETASASASATGTSGGSTSGAPTTSDASSGSSGASGASATGSTSVSGDPTSTSATTESADTTVDVTITGTTPGTSTTDDGTTTTDGPGTTTTGDGTTTTGDDTSTTVDPSDGSSSTGPGCVPTELVELSCDQIDNDCDELVDNVDPGKDGICDCLNIGILGAPGYAPNADFEAWLEDQGSAVTRTLLANNPGVITPMFLGQFDLVLLDRIERAFSPAEAAALEAFIKQDRRGMITLIGYNFDNNNPAPERDRANTALAPFGLAYQGGYFGNVVTPTFDQKHPISMGIVDVNFAGGIAPADIGNQGTSAVFATVQGTTAGLAHQTAMDGGRVVVWGDEWITFDSDWQGYADVKDFWVNLVNWARPQDICSLPQ